MSINLIFKKKFVYFFSASAVVFFLLSILVANRDLSIGSDTLSYIGVFQSFVAGSTANHEPGIYFLAAITSFFSSQYQLFFWLVYLCVSFLMAASIYNIYIIDRKRTDVFVCFFSFFGFLLFSSWYFTGVVNGLRQGVSLGFLFLSITFYLRDKKILFFILYLFSLSFHFSSLLLIPFLILLRWVGLEKRILFLYVFLAIAYVAGVNELIVRLFSDFFGLSIYEDIKFYAVDNITGEAPWSGFQWDLFAYTVFWYFFPFYINVFFNWFEDRKSVFKILNIYAILSMPYFTFGFGGFSNRYGFIAWLFLPVLQTVLFMNLKIKNKYKIIFSWLFFVIGLVYFLNRFLVD